MNRQLIEIASWRIVSELFRRYPGRFTLIETHPGGGQYDCLTLFQQERKIADFNRAGRFHVFDGPGKERPLELWDMMAQDSDTQGPLDLVCSSLGLEVPAKLPPSTPEVLVYRFIAAFLSQASFQKDRWECRNGMLDTSGYGGGPVDEYFTPFPAVREHLKKTLPDDFLNEPAYRYWFILKNGNPVICLQKQGLAWLPEGKSYELANLYAKEHRIWPVIWDVAGHLLQ